MTITPIFLTGSKTADDPAGSPNLKQVTAAFQKFVSATKKTLHIAAYHFKFTGDAADQVRGVLAKVAERAEVKLAYFDEVKRNSAAQL